MWPMQRGGCLTLSSGIGPIINVEMRTLCQKWTQLGALLRALMRSLALGLLLVMLGHTLVGAQPSREYVVKAAFLYNFTKFVDWPLEAFPDPEQVELCVLGENPFDSALASMVGKSVRGRKVSVSQIGRVEDGLGCQLVFVSPSERERLAEILTFSSAQNWLTVSDIEGFAQRGGVIGLITVDNKVRFEINLTAARRAGLNISSSLLKLAKVIEDDA